MRARPGGVGREEWCCVAGVPGLIFAGVKVPPPTSVTCAGCGDPPLCRVLVVVKSDLADVRRIVFGFSGPMDG